MSTTTIAKIHRMLERINVMNEADSNYSNMINYYVNLINNNDLSFMYCTNAN